MASNGNHTATELPPPREAIVEQGIRIQQETAAERDALRREVADLKTEIAGLKSVVEIHELNATQLESKMQTMMLVRDQAIADRTVYEVLFVSIQSQFRAFKIPAAPLIKEVKDEEAVAIPDRGPDRPFK